MRIAIIAVGKVKQPGLRSEIDEYLKRIRRYARCDEIELRDGPEAVRCAEKACLLTRYQKAQMVAVLAAAYAEAGQFDRATATAQQAVELAQAAGDLKFAATNQQLLRLYASGRPYHEPPPKAGVGR